MKQLLLFVGFSLISVVMCGQNRKSIYTTKDNLPQDFVYTVKQDDKGFIWAGTGNGLSKFDGDQFITYDTIHGLAENFVTAVAWSKDAMLVGHYLGGISTGKEGIFKKIEISIPDIGRVNRIEPFEGGFLIASQNKGLLRVDKKGNAILIEYFENHMINGIEKALENSFLVSTDEGLYFLEADNKVKQLSEVTFSSLTSSEGRIYCVSDEGLFSFGKKSKNLKRIMLYEAEDLVNNASKIIFKHHKLYGYTTGRGVWSIDIESKELEIDERFANEGFLENVYANNFEIDAEENIWIASSGAGLIVYYNDWLRKQQSYDKNEFVSIYSKDSTAYLGLKSNIYKVKDIRNKLVLDKIGEVNANIKDVFVDQHKNVWCATEKGLMVLKANAKMNHLLEVLDGKYISDINGSGESMWISTIGHGVFKVNLKEFSYKQYTTREGMLHNDIYYSYNDSKGNVWLATHNSKISYFDISEAIQVVDLPSKINGIDINSFVETKDGTLWISTSGYGVWKYTDGNLSNMTVADGLGADFAYSLFEKDNELWVGHKGNLSNINLKTNSIRSYREIFDLGEVDLFVNSFSFFQNKILMASSDGLFSINTNNPLYQKTNSSLYLKSVFVNGALKKATKNLELPSGRHTVKLEANTIRYNNRSSVYYQYKISGDIDMEGDISKVGEITYPGLSYGTYSIDIRASLGVNSFGNWKRLLEITIDKPFYLKWWFILLVVSSIILIPYVFYKVRMDNLEKQNIVLEEKVVERTKVINKQKNRMEKDLTVARDIQMSMLPVDFPNTDKISLFAKMLPAREVGGDFYDFYYIDEEHLFICVGDVSGKSAPAALFMAYAKSVTSAMSTNNLSTADIITKVNTIVEEGNSSFMFVTMFVAILHIPSGNMVYTNAGHNPTLIKKSNGEVQILKNVHGPVVAAMGGIPFKEDTMLIEPGDKIIVYTDGVTEAMNILDELYSDEKFISFVTDTTFISPEEVTEKIIVDVLDYTGEAEQFDDITVLSLFYKG